MGDRICLRGKFVMYAFFCVFVGLCIRSGLFLPQSCCRSRVVWCRFFILCYVVCFVLYCFRGCVLFFVVVIYYNVYVFFCIVCPLFLYLLCCDFFLRFFYSCDMFGFHAVVYVFMFFMYCCVVKKVV